MIVLYYRYSIAGIAAVVLLYAMLLITKDAHPSLPEATAHTAVHANRLKTGQHSPVHEVSLKNPFSESLTEWFSPSFAFSLIVSFPLFNALKIIMFINSIEEGMIPASYHLA
jgi:hypothetical protein